MEPFTALGLAAAVVQFVEFGGDLLRGSREIYTSAAGTTAEHIDMEALYANLSRLSEKLSVPSQSVNHISTQEKHSLAKLAASCKEVADELLDACQQLKIQGSSHCKWKSFRQALKTVWKKKYIDSLQKRLDWFSGQLSIQFTAIIRDEQSELLKEIRYLAQESSRMDFERKEEMEKLAECVKETRAKVGFIPTEKLSDEETKRLAADLSEVTLGASTIATEHKILQSLYFRTLHARHTKITPAHTKTFDWMYETSSRRPTRNIRSIEFVKWLRFQSGVYWVTGKPGSGKSTLMKFLSDNPKTEKHLQEWAGGSKLVIASYYFWNAGNAMQKSHEGLLQSLLYDILRKCPGLIQTACPSRWNSIEMNFVQDRPWDLSELAHTMQRLLQQQCMSAKFCFFIDGLDEYEGDHNEIIRVLYALAQVSSIKICLSSRPWNIFEDAYGQDKHRKLYVQDLTRGDIECYVRDKLENHRAFKLLSSEEPSYQSLIEQTVNKSNGVFLWVYLVVRSLLEGLTNHDSVRDLQARLDRFPADLEQFFQHILDQVDVVYHRDMARTFQEILQATEPLTLIAHSFLDEPENDFYLRLKICEMDKYDIYSRNSKMRRRIDGRCKGLLEVSFDPPARDFWAHRVEFLHRTVRDFLLTKEMQIGLNLEASGRENFNANQALCRGYLALMKTMPQRHEDLNNRGMLRLQLDSLLYHARLAEAESGYSDRDLMDDLEHTILDLSSNNEFRALTLDSTVVGKPGFTASLFEMAVASGLNKYVGERLDETPSLCSAGQMSILGFALQMWTTSRHGELDNSGMVRLLLDRKADLNVEAPNGQPLWAAWLLQIAKDYSSAKQHPHRIQTLHMILHSVSNPVLRPAQTLPVWNELLRWIESVGNDRKSPSVMAYMHQILEAILLYGGDPKDIPVAAIARHFPPKLATALTTTALSRTPRPVKSRRGCFTWRMSFWMTRVWMGMKKVWGSRGAVTVSAMDRQANRRIVKSTA